MKRILILLLSIFIIPTFCFASNYKVQNNIEYKREIENKIHKEIPKEIPKIKRNIDKESTKAEKTYNKQVKDKNIDTDKYIFIMQDYQREIENSDVLLIYSLIKITDNYINIKNNVPATDNTETLLEFIEPYFISNNINYSKLNGLKIYKHEKINKIHSFIK